MLILQFAPAGGGAGLLFGEDPREVALREKPRGFGDPGDGLFGMLHEHALGVFQTQHRDPFPERGVVSRLDVIGQIGPVGPEFLGQLLDGESRLCESVPVEPECEFRRNGEVPDRRGILAVGEILPQ